MNRRSTWTRTGISAVALAALVVLAFGSSDTEELAMTPDDDFTMDGVELVAPATPPAPMDPAPTAKPASVVKATPDAAPEAAPEAAPAAVGGATDGTITKHSGSTVVVKVSGSAPPKGATVQVTKQVNQKLFGANVTASLNIGKAVVDSVSGSKVTLKITEKQSTVVVNGKEKDHFESGAEVGLAW